jgi:hypothetical protein
MATRIILWSTFFHIAYLILSIFGTSRKGFVVATLVAF